MNIDNIQSVLNSSSSLTLGSYMSPKDLAYLMATASVSNFPFGQSPKDLIDFGVYTLDNQLISSKIIVPSSKWIDVSGSYSDISNKTVAYSYSKFSSDLVVTTTGSQNFVLLDVAEQMNSMSIGDGSYRLAIQLQRDVVGSSQDDRYKLAIDQISPSKTEISLIPSVLRTGTEEGISDFLSEVVSFGTGSVKVGSIQDQLVAGIANPEMYSIFYSASSAYPTASAAFLHYYGFKTQANAINFLLDIYYGVNKGDRKHDGTYSARLIYGIYDQFINWLNSNHETLATFTNIRDAYYSFANYIVTSSLNNITSYQPNSYSDIVAFLMNIFYAQIFDPAMKDVEAADALYFRGYFKNHLNFGDGNFLPILNVKLVANANSVYGYGLVVKLASPLSTDYSEGDRLCISNLFASPPIIQNLYYFTKIVIQTIKLRGPNFNVKIENEGNGTETLSIEQVIGESGSLYDELYSKLNAKLDDSFSDTIDYTKFENFITFSSAQKRLEMYDRKSQSLASLKTALSLVEAKLLLQPNDVYYQKNKKTLNDGINALQASFDGYEKFLQNNPSWYASHSAYFGSETSASLFDMDNLDSLSNNLPEFISGDEKNQDYVSFVEMIGHYFDNTSLYIKQFTEKNNHANSYLEGISLDVVHEALRSLGWDPEISRENLPLLLSSFSKADFDPSSSFYNKVGSISEQDRNRIIWKRLLNNLPFIYKTKGTEASINAVISCFGIPKNLIKLKEYGGINSTVDSQDESKYIFDSIKYEPYFSGSGEFFQIPWTGSIHSIEFNVSFDPYRFKDAGKYVYLAQCQSSWNIGVIHEKGEDWGRVFFNVSDGLGHTQAAVSGRVPIFDGNTYSVMVRRNAPHPSFRIDSASQSTIDAYPNQYDLLIKKAEDTRVVFSTEGTVILSGSYNSNFRSGSVVQFGDMVASGTFYGTIDEIKLWESPLADAQFIDHVLYRGSYDSDTPENTVQDNLVHVSFDYPIELSNPTGSVVTLNNLAFRKDFPTFEAHNFVGKYKFIGNDPECPLPSDFVSQYPYEFTKKTIRQTAKVPSYGASKFRSNKVNFIEQKLTSPLSAKTRSSTPLSEVSSVDSNKLGIFFSPSELENEEILKFFGTFNIDDFIGDPQDIYAPSYKQFEKFREIYYDQGLGVVDYQSFMNMVRAYFDKSMFKYIRSMVPARAKLVEGLMVEPTILERPKFSNKPVVKELINVPTASIRNSHFGVSGIPYQQLSDVIELNTRGLGVLNDTNHIFMADLPDAYGYSVYSDNGLVFFNDQYYRGTIVKRKRTYQTHRKYNLSGSQLTEEEKQLNYEGAYQTISRSYYEVSLAPLPPVTSYALTIKNNFGGAVIHFSGSISAPFSGSGVGVYSSSVPHDITGSIYGSNLLISDRLGVTSTNVIYDWINVTGSFVYQGDPVTYNGYYDGTGFFNGLIIFPPSPNDAYNVSFISQNLTGSVFDEFMAKTSGPAFSVNAGVNYRLEVSKNIIQANSEVLNGYFSTHYKYKKKIFSQKEINSYDQNNLSFKWKRGSQNKTTTVDESTGLLNNTDPVETKTT